MSKPRRMQERRTPAWFFAASILKPVLTLVTRPHWVDCTKIPATGGAVIAANLDGGSSSTLYYNGKVINKPADLLGERMIPTAFVVK